ENGVGGQGNFPGQLGGWGAGNGGAYAVASGANGDCYSPDRMFKLFKVGGADGQYVNQTITALPAGNYNWSFYTQWNDVGHANGTNGLPTWSADGDSTPKFTVLYEDADGAWVSDQETVLPEPSAAFTWVQSTGTYTNTETRNVRIKFAKNGGTATAPSNLDKLMFIDEASFAYASASAPSSDLALQGILDFSLPGKYFRGFHLKATADIADLSVYSMETYSSGDRLTANNTYTLSGSASAGDDILFWFSNAENAANIYMNASNIFDVVVDESANNWNGYNGDDPLTLSMNGTVVETYGELGVDGSGEAWEYTDTWAYKVDGAWTYGDVNCTDGSYYMWDSGCVYPLAIGQQATGASTDLVTAFSHDFHTMSQAGLWYNDGEAPIERVTTNPADADDAMKYTDDGSQAYSNMQIQFTSKVDMSSMNTFTVDVYVDGTTTTGTAPVNLALKLQDSSEGTPWTNQNVIIQDITADTWTTLTFAFNDDASMSRDDVDRIVVQFNGEGNNDQVVAYMKNMVGSYTEPVATLYTDVTFTVNTSTIEVGANGMYLGGGVIGSATAYAMTDADGDGTWEVTVSLEEGTTGNYIFLNSPSNESDWGTKEDLGGQECGDAANYNDRILAAVGADDYTLQHCFGNCYIDGTCGPVGPCDSALALTPGTTQTGNTSDFGDLFDDSTCLGSYDGGDDALFMYTATEDGEMLNVTVTGQAGWSGVAMSQGCPTEGGEVCVGSQTSSSSDALNFTSDPLIAGEVYYIHISTYPSPQTTDFILDTAVMAAPSPIVPDYTNDFTEFPGAYWSATSGTSAWVADGFANDGTTGAAKSNMYSSGNTQVLESPIFDLSGGNYSLNLRAAVTAWNGTDALAMGSDDSVTVSVSVDGGDYVVLHTWNESNNPGPTGADMPTVDLTSYSSANVKFAITMSDGTVNDAEDYDFFVDDFSITAPFVSPTWAGDWQLDPTAGSLAVGPNAGDLSWWSSNADTPAERACLFDDIYRFGADGTFENILGDQTWLEGWQEGQEGEGCGAPIAPHDGSNAASYTYTGTSVTVSGSGAFLGLAKVHNAGEDGAPAGDTITYEVISVDETYMTVHINFGGGVWAFRFINSTALGIDDVNPVSSFNFFPNPVNDVLTIKAQASIDSITVYNMLGQAVVRSTPNTTDSTVDMSALQTGAYFVQVSINNTVKTVRVIKN
ncbi:T9SS type A sorting domain-containing protein, partial [Flavobacteriaceae bacterium]|nr:T9SS type A sorting domain-containing protein [Flavobacteriaceae bacterium]